MKGNGKSFLLIIMMAFIMTVSLAGGYVVITRLSPAVKEKFDAYTDPVVESLKQDGPEEAEEVPFAYRGTDRSDYTGPKIYESAGYLINSDGKVVSDYRNGIGSSLRITTNKDASKAVFTNMGMGYYVDADLNVTEFSKHTGLAGMSFDGNYFFYVTNKDTNGNYLKELYLYDLQNKTEQLIAEGGFRSVCISPNGRTLVFTRGPHYEEIHVIGLDMQREKVFEARDDCTPVSVSNDGETVFYYIDSNDTVYYCLDHGRSTKLGKKDYRECYLDRECKQFLYTDNKHRVKYYRAGEKKPITLARGDEPRIKVNEDCAISQDLYMDEHIIDADSFADAVMIKSDQGCYALRGYTPELVNMTKGVDKVFYVNTYVTGDGPMCIYQSGMTVYRAVYDGESVSTDVLYDPVRYSMDLTCSPDLKKVWVRDGKSIYFIGDDKEPKLIKTLGEEEQFTNYALSCDPLEDLCYYIVDGVLYCADDDPESIVAVTDNCKYLTRMYDDPDLVVVSKVNGDQVFVVKKETFDK